METDSSHYISLKQIIITSNLIFTFSKGLKRPQLLAAAIQYAHIFSVEDSDSNSFNQTQANRSLLYSLPKLVQLQLKNYTAQLKST